MFDFFFTCMCLCMYVCHGSRRTTFSFNPVDPGITLRSSGLQAWWQMSSPEPSRWHHSVTFTSIYGLLGREYVTDEWGLERWPSGQERVRVPTSDGSQPLVTKESGTSRLLGHTCVSTSAMSTHTQLKTNLFEMTDEWLTKAWVVEWISK